MHLLQNHMVTLEWMTVWFYCQLFSQLQLHAPILQLARFILLQKQHYLHGHHYFFNHLLRARSLVSWNKKNLNTKFLASQDTITTQLQVTVCLNCKHRSGAHMKHYGKNYKARWNINCHRNGKIKVNYKNSE
jgi:hypothetical protein